MQAQAVLLQPLRQHPKHPPRVVLVLEHQYGVVGVPDLKGPSAKPWFHFMLEPLVQHLMQINVTQRRIWEPYDYGNLNPRGR